MPPKKEEPQTNLLPEVIVLLLIVLVISTVYVRGAAILEYYHLGWILDAWHSLVGWVASHGRHLLVVAATIISALAAAALVYSGLSLREIHNEERPVFAPAHPPVAKLDGPAGVSEKPKNEQWERIVAHLSSPNNSDWRLAIIGADIMLDNLLTDRGYHGESIGEKLKSVDKSDFLTLDAAWQAHKVRNRIAHEGPDFVLGEREAKQTLALYESVFKEFKII